MLSSFYLNFIILMGNDKIQKHHLKQFYNVKSRKKQKNSINLKFKINYCYFYFCYPHLTLEIFSLKAKDF